MARSLNFNNGTQIPQPSYNFQNTPSFDFTHQPTSASRKTDKRPGELNDSNTTTNVQSRPSSDNQSQQQGSSSSSNSPSTSPRHKSKRTCPETKEIDCTTDDGFWIQKQYYHALDDASKELFDSLIDKLEKIRIASEENAARKQQRLVGRTRTNKSRLFTSSISSIIQANEDTQLNTKSTTENKVCLIEILNLNYNFILNRRKNQQMLMKKNRQKMCRRMNKKQVLLLWIRNNCHTKIIK